MLFPPIYLTVSNTVSVSLPQKPVQGTISEIGKLSRTTADRLHAARMGVFWYIDITRPFLPAGSSMCDQDPDAVLLQGSAIFVLDTIVCDQNVNLVKPHEP